MKKEQIKAIEDYCKELPKKHIFIRKFITERQEKTIKKILPELFEKVNETDFPKKARKIYKKYHLMPKKSQLATVYDKMIENGELPKSDKLDEYLRSHVCRSISGVSVVAVFLSPYPNGQNFSCQWDCKYCPKEEGMPKSYLFKEPGVLRAVQNNFECIKQIYSRLSQYKANRTPIDKLEIIVLGGTIHSYPDEYLHEFMRDIYYASNTFLDKIRRSPYSLAKEQEENQMEILLKL